MINGRRVLARLRAGGPSWIHVFVDDAPDDASQVPFTLVLRGVSGGVIDGVTEVMSTVSREGRLVLHLRILELATAASPRLLARFAREILNDDSPNPLVVSRERSIGQSTKRLSGARHDAYQCLTHVSEDAGFEDGLIISKAALWRDGRKTTEAELIRSSSSGRRLLVRLNGPVPSAWASVKLELDLGCMGEPRPVQLSTLVVGILPTEDAESCHVLVRLLRWSEESDRLVWHRWLRYQQRLDTACSPIEATSLVTRTIPRAQLASPPT